LTSASMGPRSIDRGILDGDVVLVPAARGFNGAAIN